MAEILCGFLAGIIFGFFLAIKATQSSEEIAMRSGYIKIGGNVYKLSKLPDNRDAP